MNFALLLARVANDFHRLLHVMLCEPEAIFIGEFALSRDRLCRVSLCWALQTLANLKALEFPRSRTRQVILPDVIAKNAFGAGQLCRQTLDVEAQHFARVHDFALAEAIKIGDDHGMQSLGEWLAGSAFDAHYANVFN